jgi:putative hydrolase of the HAD superfamily
MAFQGLILDFGEVLTRSQSKHIVERMASIAQLPFDEFVSRYWEHRAAYDGGLSGMEYWRRVLEQTGNGSPAAIAMLIESDASSWSDFRPETWDIAAQFRGRGNRTAMLSNGVSEIISRIRARRPLDAWFDVVVVSCEVGCCKPDPGIYNLCVERLGVPPELTLFIDDRMENLNAAESVGLHTFHFTGDSSVSGLRSALGL